MADQCLVERLREEVSKANEALFEARRQLEDQRSLAARVHQSLLPSPVRTARLDVDIRYLPVDDLGGDYCQVRFAGPHACYITLCHVAGQGLAPALLATRVSSEVRHGILRGFRPSEIVKSLNAFIYEYFRDLNPGVTFMVARIDVDAKRVTYSGAGHPGALLLRPEDGLVQRLTSQNASIGVRAEVLTQVPETVHPIGAGDRLLFFTEGVIRTVDKNGQRLGQSGLAQLASKSLSSDLFQMTDVMLDELARFRHGPTTDDLTLIVAEMK